MAKLKHFLTARIKGKNTCAQAMHSQQFLRRPRQQSYEQ